MANGGIALLLIQDLVTGITIILCGKRLFHL